MAAVVAAMGTLGMVSVVVAAEETTLAEKLLMPMEGVACTGLSCVTSLGLRLTTGSGWTVVAPSWSLSTWAPVSTCVDVRHLGAGRGCIRGDHKDLLGLGGEAVDVGGDRNDRGVDGEAAIGGHDGRAKWMKVL